MKKVEIAIVKTIDAGCFGVLCVDDVPIALTLWRTFTDAERPGEPVVIKPGLYRCTRTVYHKKGYATFEIHVEGHSRVLFHIGNLEDDSLGCVLVGEEFAYVNGRPGIARSGAGFGEFMNRMTGVDEFDLVVRKEAA
jgi:hypothetical protein